MIPEAVWRSHLAGRAEAAAGLDLRALAVEITTRQPRRPRPSARFLGGVSVAATVALAVAIGGGLLLRGVPAASPPLANGPTGSVAPHSSEPGPTPPATAWTNLIWSSGDVSAFGGPGSTVLSDGLWDGSSFTVVGTWDSGSDAATRSWAGRVWRSADGHSWTRLDDGHLPAAVLARGAAVG